MDVLRRGQEFAGYRIEGVAGRGGMGVVYRATELSLERVVALKVIAPALAEDAEFRRRFVRESKTAAAIEHPNVLPIYAADVEGDVLYIAMRYVEGQDLRTLIRALDGLEPARTARIVAQMGVALDAAHARGLVHRDVKPANVLLGAHDHAYLTDFGLTKRMHSDSGLTRSGGWVGTIGYVAPEQIRGEPVDARADVYALGCVLVHALTGRAPYVRETDEATMWAHLSAPPPGRADGVPEAFVPVVARAMAKDPEDRYPSAGDLGRAALAAAGEAPAPTSERTVAVGDAAPGAAADADETRATPTTADGSTRSGTVRATAATTAQPAARRGRRLAPVLAAVAVVAVAAVAAVLVATGGGEDPATPEGPPNQTGAGEEDGLRISEGTPVDPVVRSPTAVAVAGGSAWVASYRARRLARVDADTGRRRPPSERIPAGTTGMTARGSRLYFVSEQENTLTQMNGRTGRIVGKPRKLPPGNPFSVDTDRNAIWIGSRGSRNRNPVQRVQRVPRGGGEIKEIPIDRGVQSLAVSNDAVWVTNGRGSSVTRLDKRTGRLSLIEVGEEPKGVAVGSGYVWVVNTGSASVTRIDPDTRRTATVSVGPAPQLAATGGGAVWVTVRDTSQLVRIDPRDVRVTDRIDTALNPFGVTYADGAAWVTSLGQDVVQRVTAG